MLSKISSVIAGAGKPVPVFMKGAQMKRIIPILMAALLFLLHTPVPAYAAEKEETKVWIRAQIGYESDEGMQGISDEMIGFASDLWTKKDGFFYYGKPVESGESIDLMKSVQIPTDWNNAQYGKSFSVIVKVEAAEAFPSDTGWNDGSAPVYSQSFTLSEAAMKDKGYTIKQGNIKVRLEEFQEENGREVPYENNRIVVPGETVSKIVRITVEGEKSKLSLIEIIRGPVKTGDKSGISLYIVLLILAGAALAGYFTGRNGGGHGGLRAA